MRNLYKMSVGKSERTISLRRPTLGWKDIIKIDLKEIESEGVYHVQGGLLRKRLINVMVT
jgi:hypothetical protein